MKKLILIFAVVLFSMTAMASGSAGPFTVSQTAAEYYSSGSGVPDEETFYADATTTFTVYQEYYSGEPYSSCFVGYVFVFNTDSGPTYVGDASVNDNSYSPDILYPTSSYFLSTLSGNFDVELYACGGFATLSAAW